MGQSVGGQRRAETPSRKQSTDSVRTRELPQRTAGNQPTVGTLFSVASSPSAPSVTTDAANHGSSAPTPLFNHTHPGEAGSRSIRPRTSGTQSQPPPLPLNHTSKSPHFRFPRINLLDNFIMAANCRFRFEARPDVIRRGQGDQVQHYSLAASPPYIYLSIFTPISILPTLLQCPLGTTPQ